MSQGFAKTSSRQAPKPNFAASASEVSQHLQEYFSEIKDPGVERRRVHELTDILMVAILAVIAGAKGWQDIEVYGLSKQAWLQSFLGLPHGIACADTFRRVFERIELQSFERCFQRWVGEMVEQVGAQVIPIDGKTLLSSSLCSCP